MRRHRSLTATLAVVAIVLGALLAPSLAAAQSASPTDSQYNDTLTQINAGDNGPGSSSNGNGSGGLSDNVGPLPFTGFDVIAMAAVALAVAALGLAIQRAVSRDPSDDLTS